MTVPGAAASGRPLAAAAAAPVAWMHSSGFALVLLAATSAAVAVHAAGWWSPFTPLGDDASSHITAIARMATAMREGRGWWAPDYNLGFPMALYYQPLPHIVSGALCALLGGAAAAPLVYKVLAALMLVIQPWAVFRGMRRAGFDSGQAACVGALSPLALKGIEFGYNAHASLSIGLYTQAWGHVAFPLAVGELVALARGRGSLLAAAVASAFTASTHMFFAIALVPPLAVTALLLGAPVRGAMRLALAGIGAFCLLAWWLVPLSLTQAFFGGWPFGSEHRVDGYGFDRLWGMFVDGSVIDGERDFPVLMWLAAAGVVIAPLRVLLVPRDGGRRSANGAAVVGIAVLGAWSTLGSIGRADGGWVAAVVDAYPLHGDVQLFRYGAVLQFVMLVLAGTTICAVMEVASRAADAALRATRRPVPPVARDVALTLPALALAAVPIWTALPDARVQLTRAFRTIDDASAFRPEPYAAAVEAVRALPEGGRVLVSKRTGLRGHYHSGLFAWASGRPAGQSYGVGLHDALNFYPLEYFHPEKTGAEVLADLYDFRTIVAAPDADLDGLGDIEWTYEAEHYRVGRLAGAGVAGFVATEGDEHEGAPRAVREDIRNWLAGNGPALRIVPTLRVTDPRDRAHLTDYPRGEATPTMLTQTAPLPGDVVRMAVEADRFRAEVTTSAPGLFVAKIGYHPFWQIRVDGQPGRLVFAYPSFVATRLDAGEHVIEGQFRWPWWARALVGLLWLPFVMLPRFDRSVRFGPR